MDIITTIGPQSWSHEVITAFLDLGVSCIRFPFAKETPIEHVQRSLWIREIAAQRGGKMDTLVDLPGGKPRLSNGEPIDVSSSESLRIGIGSVRPTKLDLTVVPELSSESVVGMAKATIGDGENEFIVDSISEGLLTGHFLRTGTIERHRSFIPSSAKLKIPSFTENDKRLARIAQQGCFDWLAVSFVDSAKCVKDVRAWLVDELGWSPKIVAKIETLAGVESIREIARTADAVLVARGDLAVQVGVERLWDCQEKVIKSCKEEGAYVITGTGILESMVRMPYPTRAEVMDVCASLAMGADALMLSAETTIGTYPRETVKCLRAIESGWRSR